jgi:ApaG protein
MSQHLPTVLDNIVISIDTHYIAQQSDESQQQFVFAYTITIANNSDNAVKLLNRYWLITDANNDSSTVSGEGVIGQQPLIASKQSFTYTSGCLLKTPVGNMQGHYQMRDEHGSLFDVNIPIFRLAKPNIHN